MSETYSVDEATAQLTDIIARVRRGETIAISDHGVRVAEIRPVAAARDTLEERLDHLEAAGELTRPRASARGDLFPSVATVPGALQRFLYDRGDRAQRTSMRRTWLPSR